MKNVNPEGRIRYLALALFSQRIVDALIDFVTEDKSEPMIACVREALASLPTFSSQDEEIDPGPRTFASYEHVRTLQEAAKPPNSVNIVLHSLKRLESSKGSKAEQKKDAKRAIEFFYRLEKQALLNYDRPVESLPRGIRELCKAP